LENFHKRIPDRFAGAQISTDEDKQNMFPFPECVDDIILNVNGKDYIRWQLPNIII